MVLNMLWTIMAILVVNHHNNTTKASVCHYRDRLYHTLLYQQQRKSHMIYDMLTQSQSLALFIKI
jgi:hypothetical protein